MISHHGTFAVPCLGKDAVDWTYDIDTTVPRNRNDGIERPEVYADNCEREETRLAYGLVSI